MQPPVLLIMLILSAGLIAYSIWSTRTDSQQRMRRRLRADSARPGLPVRPQTESTTGKWIKEKIAPALAKPVRSKSEENQSRLKVKLANAGFRREGATVIFLASKTLLGIGLLLLTLLAAAGSGHPVRTIFGLASISACVGFLLPNLWLWLAAKSRAEKLTHSLPDCLDLLVVCVEAGLGLDAAMQRVSQEMGNVHPELAEEFTLTNMEVQMGIPRSDALTNLATRTGVPEIKSLTAILIQAERFGTSIASALRVHADSLRTKRRQKAEERAAKTAVKLIIPLILFIFPAIFVVLAGPAVLKLWETLTSTVFTGKG